MEVKRTKLDQNQSTLIKELSMFARLQKGKKLPLAEKFTRLKTRLSDPEWRRYGRLLFAGKAMGVGVLLLIITVISGLFFGRVFAADAEVKPADIVNPI